MNAEEKLIYWQGFTAAYKNSDCNLGPFKPYSNSGNYMELPPVGLGFRLCVRITPRDSIVAVEWITRDTELGYQHLRHLSSYRSIVQQPPGSNLIWTVRQDLKSFAKVETETSANFGNHSDWSQQHQWLIEMLRYFSSNFVPNISDWIERDGWIDERGGK